MPLAAAIFGLLVGKEQTDAISALKNEDDGSEEQWDISLADHSPNLPARWAGCQTGGATCGRIPPALRLFRSLPVS
jgi:hypothetical protein